MFLNRILALIIFLFCCVCVTGEEYRTFTGSNGRKIEAKFIAFDPETQSVKLIMKDGREQNVKLDSFSEEDIEWIKAGGKTDNPSEDKNRAKNPPVKTPPVRTPAVTRTSTILGADALLKKIRKDHPRLFFNKSSFESVKKRALNEESQLFGEMKGRVNALLGQEIKFNDPLVRDGTQNSDHEYGARAAEAAFVYLVTEDKKYLELAKKILVNLVGYYTFRNEKGLNIAWESYSRINTLAAYDWIYNDLTKQERINIGTPLLKAIHYMQPTDKRRPFLRENWSDYTTGFYGTRCLAWHAGLVFYNDGIDDRLAEQLLLKGYKDHTELLKYRSNIAGKDGGAATAVMIYNLYGYPWAEFNFLHTAQSATGVDISNNFPYIPKFVNYIFWNWLPGNKEFGFGDSHHFTNDIPMWSLHTHLSQMIHFYGKSSPGLVAGVKWMQAKARRPGRDVVPFTRFLLTNTFDDIAPAAPDENLPKAKRFENMGQIFMRSGSGDDDTYALFTAGGTLSHHKHFDNNNFVIFKKGFLALDSGTRPEPGLHTTHYYGRTVAHNCVLIKMPDEKMPNCWSIDPALSEKNLPIPNDGGQNNALGSKVIAFDENKEYVYIASDATESYHKDKVTGVARQFVFLPPDCFVIFDRIRSTKAEYPKTWLLHTAREPIVNGNVFYADQMEGRLFCKTVFPEGAKLTKIGGDGKQFWSDGRNWPLPVLTSDDWNYSRYGNPQNTSELLGQWRMEVTPARPAVEDCFLHLIQVGDRSSLKSMVDSTALKNRDTLGVKFTYADKEYEINFNTIGKVGGRLSIRSDQRQPLNVRW